MDSTIETDLTGVNCDVLKRFMECENMHNIEELSFMRTRGNQSFSCRNGNDGGADQCCINSNQRTSP